MNKILTTILIGVIVLPMVSFGLIVTNPEAPSASAYICQDGSSVATADDCTGEEKPTCLFSNGDCEGVFTRIVNVMLYLIGAISVLMIIYGGIRYTISGGNATAVTAAKNTIMYAVVGVVVALLAFAIVNFVLGSLITA